MNLFLLAYASGVLAYLRALPQEIAYLITLALCGAALAVTKGRRYRIRGRLDLLVWLFLGVQPLVSSIRMFLGWEPILMAMRAPLSWLVGAFAYESSEKPGGIDQA